MSISTTARILSTAAAAALALAALSGCSLITTLSQAGGETPTSSEPATSGGPIGEGVESPPATTDAPGPTEQGHPTSLFDIKVGDCFDLVTDQNNASLYSSCDVLHTYEAFGVVTLTDATWPGDDAVSDKGFDGCKNMFLGYVGTNYGTSSYDIYLITPSEQTWNEMNDREVLCLVYPGDGSQAVGSAANSRR